MKQKGDKVYVLVYAPKGVVEMFSVENVYTEVCIVLKMEGCLMLM